MQVEITPNKEKSQAELDVTVPFEDFKPYIDQAAKKLSENTEIKGFRPGTAPAEVVAEHVGTERLLREAMDMGLPQFFVKAATEHEVEAINRPSVTIKQLGMDTPLQFSAVVDILPEVELGDPSTIEVDKRETSVDDQKVEDELNYLAKMRAETIDVARPAQEEDVVTVDFQVKVNGEVIEGGESQNHPFTIGEGAFVPEFEEKIKGMEAGEERTFEMTFPDDFPKEDLRGKKAEVDVKAHSVQKRVPPELNDEFAKSLGQFESIDQLRSTLKSNMEAEAENKEHERYLGEIAEKLAEKSSFGPIPDVLIEKEISRRLEEFEQMLGYQQKSMEDYLQKEGKTLEQVREDMRPAAEQHVKIGLTLRQFASKHDVQVPEEELEQEVNKQLEQFKSAEDAQQQVDPQDIRDQVESMLKNRKTLEKLAEQVENS